MAEPEPEDAVEPEPEDEPEPEPEDAEESVPPDPKPIAEAVVPADAVLTRAQSGPPFPNIGISLEGLDYFLARHGSDITEEMTTSDVCHTIIKPATTPRGWTCVATLIDAEKGWYRHDYTDEGGTSSQVPKNTCSLLLLMKRDPATARFVGPPTIFLSHAWSYKFRSVIKALRTYVLALPEGEPRPFFWFDTFSIDEHATQTLTPEWWRTTFQDAIRGIGCTLMVMSPWNDPIPLRRAWCLWEVFSTHKVGADFRICLGPEEQEAFEQALMKDSKVVFQAFAHINVEKAEAGTKEDQTMI